MTPTLLTPSEAFEIASQWGSYIRAGDPGAIFYTFPLNDARPQGDDHRAACLAYTDDLLTGLEDGDVEDRAELTALRAFFATVRDTDGKAPLLDLAPTEGFNSTTQPRQGAVMTGDETFNSLS